MENPDNMDTQPMDLEPVFAACVNNEKKQIFASKISQGRSWQLKEQNQPQLISKQDPK